MKDPVVMAVYVREPRGKQGHVYDSPFQGAKAKNRSPRRIDILVASHRDLLKTNTPHRGQPRALHVSLVSLIA